MSHNFARLVEEVKRLSADEKEELKYLLDQYMLEERRSQILKNYKESRKELRMGALQFSGDPRELRSVADE